MKLSATVLGAPDPRALANFYAQLLGWNFTANEPGWVTLRPPTGGTGLSFQEEADYSRPVWPQKPGEQQMMMHLDIGVDDLQTSVKRAIELGASLAEFQPQEDVRVMLDPAGHPFCLFPADF
ncbi:MAG: VOC family protein [Chloroflexi bacterium]|nr:VOC family protein [Chloroflexota bacterium]